MSIAFLYKCRRCGAIEQNPHMDGEHANAIIELLRAIQGTPELPMSPTMIHVHSCDKNASGLSDLIGYEAKENT